MPLTTLPADKPDGALDEWMTKIFGRSWRTSWRGVVTLACAGVVVADRIVQSAPLHTAAQICIALGLAGAASIGLAAKDKHVSGGNR